MKTIELFRQDVYMKSATAVVKEITEQNGKVLVTLDQTIFFPEGGGQSCDTGTMAGFDVVDVYEREKEIYHQVKCAPDAMTAG